MKKIVMFFVFIAFAQVLNAQITLNATYSNNPGFYLDKFPVSGYKLVKTDIANLKIEIYNVNHTIFKVISIPPQTDPINSISYVSENLFDNDNLMEFAMTTYSSSNTFTAPPYYRFKFYIFKENGNQLFFRDSAIIQYGGNTNAFNNSEGIFFDGINTRMRLNIQTSTSQPGGGIQKTAFYTLPGSIPCVECSATGTVSGIFSPGGGNPNNPVFYPNPVTDQLKLKYELPPDYKNAEIKIYDLQGKLIETFKVTNTFDFIYLPSDYNNGLYLYSLNVDGKVIKTEKIILNK